MDTDVMVAYAESVTKVLDGLTDLAETTDKRLNVMEDAVAELRDEVHALAKRVEATIRMVEDHWRLLKEAKDGR